jgi:hypothetical protein
LAGGKRGEEKIMFAQLAAAQGERDGFYELGWCFSRGDGCRKDLDKARENFLQASELGHVWAMIELGRLLSDLDHQCWAMVGPGGISWRKLEFFSQFCSTSSVVQFWLWKLKGHVCNWTSFARHVNEEARTVFNIDYAVRSSHQPCKASNRIL